MAGYARTNTADIQSGQVVKSAPINAELNAIVTAFAFSGGHNHDGSSTEGAYVGLIADTDALNKVVVDTSNNRIGFFSEVSSAATEQVRIQDGAILPVTDNDIDLGASGTEFKDLHIDGTAHIDTLDVDENATVAGTLGVTGVVTANAGVVVDNITIDGTEIDLSSGDLTVDVAGDIILDADGADVLLKDAGTQYAALTNSSGNLIIKSGSTTALTFSGANVTAAGEVSMTTLDIGGTNVTSTAAELNILDGVTATTAELNIMDGVTATTAELNIMDGVTSTAAELNILDGVTATTAELNIMDGVTATTAELNIMDGVTATASEINIIDGNTSATSTTVADADRVILNDNGTMVQVAVTDLAAYFDDEITAMPNLVTTAATTVGTLDSGAISSGFGNIDTGSSTITTTGLITGGSLDIDDVVINGSTIGHTDDTDLITVANGIATVAGEISVTTLDIGGTNVSATATELNIMDGDTTATSTTLADADRVVVNDAGTMKQVALTDFETYFESALDTLSNVTTVGALNSGSITSGFGAIDNGSSAITTTGTITYGSLSDGSITITAFVDEDNMASNSATLVPTQQSVKAYVDTQLTAEDLDITTDSGTIDIDLDSETLTIAGGTGLSSSASSSTVTMAIDAAQTGITSVVNSSLELGRDADNRIKFGTDNQIIFEVDGGDNVIFKASGEIEATSLDISGDADIDGTLEADAITVNGTALNTVIAGVTVANATTAAVATTVTISDNESTNEDNAIIFTSGGDVDGGNIGLESDGDLTYNPSTGRLTATQLSGTLQTAAQTNVTTLGTLTALTTSGKPVHDAGISVKNGSTSAGFVEFFEDSDNGTNKVTLIGPSSTADITLTLPSTAGTVATTAVASDDATALAIALG